jgi:flagellar L-ring protein precursor FlgH
MLRPLLLGLLAVGLPSLGGCGAANRLAEIGQAPTLSAVDDPTAQPGYKPVRMPMPDPQPVAFASNSLWRQGSRAFFKDQRAARSSGDIMTVRVRVTDRAQLDNQTQRTPQIRRVSRHGELLRLRDRPEESAAGRGQGGRAGRPRSGLLERRAPAPSAARSSSPPTSPPVVTQVLPNGNLVIEGKQEIRVNFEVRELIVAGVVRPEDIEADNTIDSTKIAQARIAYGGRGPDHGRAAAPLRPAGDGRAASVLKLPGGRGTLPLVSRCFQARPPALPPGPLFH